MCIGLPSVASMVDSTYLSTLVDGMTLARVADGASCLSVRLLPVPYVSAESDDDLIYL